MSTDIIIKCKSCGNTFIADHAWAEKIKPGATYASSASVYSFLMTMKTKLKCSQCSSKDTDIIYEIPPCVKKTSSIQEHEKRYINEGLAGTREGHKRMRSQHWSEMLRRSKE